MKIYQILFETREVVSTILMLLSFWGIFGLFFMTKLFWFFNLILCKLNFFKYVEKSQFFVSDFLLKSKKITSMYKNPFLGILYKVLFFLGFLKFILYIVNIIFLNFFGFTFLIKFQIFLESIFAFWVMFVTFFVSLFQWSYVSDCFKDSKKNIIYYFFFHFIIIQNITSLLFSVVILFNGSIQWFFDKNMWAFIDVILISPDTECILTNFFIISIIILLLLFFFLFLINIKKA